MPHNTFTRHAARHRLPGKKYQQHADKQRVQKAPEARAAAFSVPIL